MFSHPQKNRQEKPRQENPRPAGCALVHEAPCGTSPGTTVAALLLAGLLWCGSGFAGQPAAGHRAAATVAASETGAVGKEEAVAFGRQVTLFSQVLNEHRPLNIYLPPGYEQSTRVYPVVYLLDGAVDEDYFHLTGLVDYLATYELMPRAIVVGIANVDRRRDFTTPSQNKLDRANIPNHGGAAAFIQFLEDELQPYVRQHYRVDDAAVLIGQSLGGLLAAQVLLEKPALFTHYVLISPSLWWNDQTLIKSAAEKLAAHPTAERNVYIAVGDEHPEMVDTAQRLQQFMQASGWPALRSRYDFLADENHATALHSGAYRALRWFFADTEAAAH